MPRRTRHYIANQPYHIVIYMDVMYAGFAGAKNLFSVAIIVNPVLLK